MAKMVRCRECGRMFDWDKGHNKDAYGNPDYCSAKCARATDAARGSSSSGSSGGNSRSLKFMIPIIGILIIVGLIGAAVNGIQNALSDVKIKIVSASCETQDNFVSILKEALSEVSATVIEGEEFTTYSRQALDLVKEREGEYGLFKDSVYFVRLPDDVNAYIWFKTEDQTTAYVYKKNEDGKEKSRQTE